MTELLITSITTLAGSGVTGFFTWLFTKRKYDSEVDGQWINNMKESLEFYKTLSDDNKTRLDEVLAQNKSIIEQNEKLLKQNAELLSLNKQLQEQVDALGIKVDQLAKLSCMDTSCAKRKLISKLGKNKATNTK